MTRGWLSAGLSMFLGGLFGALVADQIGDSFGTIGHYAWAFGALAGGLLSYFLVNFKETRDGVKHALRKVAHWRPDGEWWTTYCIVLTGFFVMLFFAALVFALSICMLVNGYLTVTDIGIGAVVAGSEGGIFAILVGTLQMRDVNWHRLRTSGWRMMFWGSPIGWMVGTVWGLILIPKALRVIGAILREVVIYIHSETRTICLVSATIGAVTGYVIAHTPLSLNDLEAALIGAAIGTVIGLFSREVIAVRWLKTVPAKAKHRSR